jgi:hypothetical protein
VRASRGMGAIDKRKRPAAAHTSAKKAKPLDKMAKRAKHSDNLGKKTPKQRSMFVDGGSVIPKGNKRLVDGVKHSLKSRGDK